MRLARSAWPSDTLRPGRLPLLALLAALVAGTGCPGSGTGPINGNVSVYPPADVYEIDPEFGGEWFGDVDGLRGTLIIGAINERTFYGSFVSEDATREYTLLLDQTYVEVPSEGELPSNRTTFTWQDGLGSRGKGWLLIDQTDNALSGSFGFGVATSGLGKWSFIRVES